MTFLRERVASCEDDGVPDPKSETVLVQTRWPRDLLDRLDAFVAEEQRNTPRRRRTRTEVITSTVDRYLRRQGFGRDADLDHEARGPVDELAEDLDVLLAEIEEAASEESVRALARRAGLPDGSTGVLISRWRHSGKAPSLRVRRALARLFVEG